MNLETSAHAESLRNMESNAESSPAHMSKKGVQTALSSVFLFPLHLSVSASVQGRLRSRCIE